MLYNVDMPYLQVQIKAGRKLIWVDYCLERLTEKAAQTFLKHERELYPRMRFRTSCFESSGKVILNFDHGIMEDLREYLTENKLITYVHSDSYSRKRKPTGRLIVTSFLPAFELVRICKAVEWAWKSSEKATRQEAKAALLKARQSLQLWD